MRLLFLVTSCLLVNFLSAQYSIDPNMRSASVQILTAYNATGSGIILYDTVKNNVCLVTARHVLFRHPLDPDNKIVDSITILSYRKDVDRDPPIKFAVSLHTLMLSNNLSMDSTNDIVVLRFAKVIRKDSSSTSFIGYAPGVIKLTSATSLLGWQLDACEKMEDLNVGSDTYVIGFPTSVNYVRSYSTIKPLVRKGIIAGKDYEFKRIICDLPVNPGNSGGGVFSLTMEKNYLKTRFIGIAVAYLPFVDNALDNSGKRYNNTFILQNTGYSVIIPFDLILPCVTIFD